MHKPLTQEERELFSAFARYEHARTTGKELPLYYWQDPGHGWIACPRSFAASLGILDSISHYSYQNGDMLYLEEDCDATLLINAMKKAGIPYRLIENHTNRDSPIRNYRSFTR